MNKTTSFEIHFKYIAEEACTYSVYSLSYHAIWNVEIIPKSKGSIVTTRIRIGNLYKPSLGPLLGRGHSQNIHSGCLWIKGGISFLSYLLVAPVVWGRCYLTEKRHLKPTSKNPHTKHLSKCGRIKPQVRISQSSNPVVPMGVCSIPGGCWWDFWTINSIICKLYNQKANFLATCKVESHPDSF